MYIMNGMYGMYTNDNRKSSTNGDICSPVAHMRT